jgi:hypothetical protein
LLGECLVETASDDQTKADDDWCNGPRGAPRYIHKLLPLVGMERLTYHGNRPPPNEIPTRNKTIPAMYRKEPMKSVSLTWSQVLLPSS